MPAEFLASKFLAFEIFGWLCENPAYSIGKIFSIHQSDRFGTLFQIPC